MKKESIALRARRVGISLIVVFAMVISGLSMVFTAPTIAAQDIGGEYGGDFRVALDIEPNTLNPLSDSINEAGMQIMDLLYDSLGRVTADSLTLEPWVAKEWNVDPDNQSIVNVVLRDDVVWHDSTPLTTADVDYTFGPDGYNIPYVADMIYDATDLTNHTITFHLTAPNALFFSEMLLMKLIPDEFTINSPENGCGPFSFAGESTTVIWDRYEHTRDIWTIEAFEDYFNGRPYLDSIVYIYYEEGYYSPPPDGTLTGAGYDLMNATIDFIGWDLTSNETASTVINITRPWINPTMANPDEKNITVNTELGLEYRYLGMNTDRDHLLNDVNLRMAIAHAVDKRSLANYDISGGLVVADSIVSPEVTPWFNTSLDTYEWNRATANQILDDAGYFDAYGDGYRQLPGSGPNEGHFQFEILIPTGDEEISAPAVGDNFLSWIGKIGINVEIVSLDEEARKQRIMDDDFDMFLSTETRTSVDPGFLYDLFHSSKVSTTEENHNMFNFEGRAREYFGVVTVVNGTGQMNHTNLFDDGTANIIAYRNDEEWGVTEGQEVWTMDDPLPETLDLMNVSIDAGSYTIYRNRTVSDETFWAVNLNDANDEWIWDVNVTEVTDEWLVTVNTSYREDQLVGQSNAYIEVDQTITINAGPPIDTFPPGDRPIEVGSEVLWKEGEVWQETIPFVDPGAKRVMIVDADNPLDGMGYGYGALDLYYNQSIQNASGVIPYTWDVFGNNKAAQGKPIAADMAPYNVVIWVPGIMMEDFVGSEFDATDEGEVATYLSGAPGRSFMLSNIVWSDYTAGGAMAYFPGDFAYDYMGINDFPNTWSGNEDNVFGNATDAIFNGWGPATLNWNAGNWPAFSFGAPPGMSDEVNPIGTAFMPIFNDDGFGTIGNAAVRYDSGTFKTVFMGFPFETVLTVERDDAMDRILTWFVPPAGGYTGQLGNGTLANETILDINLFNQTSGLYLIENTNYTLDYSSGELTGLDDLTTSTIIAFYNYTTDMVLGTDYWMTAANYWDGEVDVNITVHPTNDTVYANYTWYDEVQSGLSVPVDFEPNGMIVGNYSLQLNNVDWPEAPNYVIDTDTGDIDFNNPLNAGDIVEANYTCYETFFYNTAFPINLDHGAGIDGMNIATADFRLMKNGGGMTITTEYTLDAVNGVVNVLAPGLDYGDVLTASYWYYDPAELTGLPPTWELDHGMPKDGNVTTWSDVVVGTVPLSTAFVSVFNDITGAYTNYSATGCNADLDDGTFDLTPVNPGDHVRANYQFYDPAEIVDNYDLAYTRVCEGTLNIFKNGALIAKSDYTVNLDTGHIILNTTAVPLGPHDVLKAGYSYIKDLAEGGGGFSLNLATGMLTLNDDVEMGDRVLADYTYETFTVLDFEAGQVQILNNLDELNDTLTMSFDYRKFDELIELSNEQMTYDMRAKYVKEAQGFISEEIPCLPLFFYKVANTYNNTRYEGWASTVGGVINFWSFNQLRNKILGEMQVYVSAFPGYVIMGEDIDLIIKVEDIDGNNIPEANLEYDPAYDPAEDDYNPYGDPVYNEQAGTYTVSYTAPETTTSRTLTISVTATRPSYVKGTGEVQLTVHPIIGEFEIEIRKGAPGEVVPSLESGNHTDITVTVWDKDTMEVVPDVDLSISVTPVGLGGYINDTVGTTDGAGEFATVFGSSNVTVKATFTISVTASKDGYIDKTQITSISVSQDPNIESSSSRGFLGLPAPPFLVVLFLLAAMSVLYGYYRRRR